MSWLLQVGAALGGLSFLGGIITALAMWRKSGADAASVLTDRALKANATAMENLGQQLEQTQEALEETKGELQAMRRHLRVVEQLLRRHDIPAPEFEWPLRRNEVG